MLLSVCRHPPHGSETSCPGDDHLFCWNSMRIWMADIQPLLLIASDSASGSTSIYMCNSKRHSIFRPPSCQDDTFLPNNSPPCIINYGMLRLPLRNLHFGAYTFVADVLLFNISTSGNRVFVALVEQVSLLPRILINYSKLTTVFTVLGQIGTSGHLHRYYGTNISEHSFLTFHQCGFAVSRDQTPPEPHVLLSFQLKNHMQDVVLSVSCEF